MERANPVYVSGLFSLPLGLFLLGLTTWEESALWEVSW